MPTPRGRPAVAGGRDHHIHAALPQCGDPPRDEDAYLRPLVRGVEARDDEQARPLGRTLPWTIGWALPGHEIAGRVWLSRQAGHDRRQGYGIGGSGWLHPDPERRPLAQCEDEAMERRLRIAQVNDVAAVASTLAASLRDLDVDVDLFESPRPGAGLPRWGRAVTAPLRAVAPLAVAPALRRGGYDVVHGHYAWKSMAAPLSGRPYVAHVHGTDVRDVDPGSPLGRLTRAVLRRAARAFYATPDLAGSVAAYRPDATFLPNPIDTDRFRPAPVDPAAMRDLLVGVRLAPVKGVDAIVEAVGRIVALRPETTITVVDHGPGVAAVMDAAGSGARLVPVADRLLLPDLYRSHRMALGQMRIGAIGNYELELLACGVPVVTRFRFADAYDAPPPVVDAADAQEAGTRTVALLGDEAARRTLTAASPSWVQAHHAAGSVARRVMEVYREILARP